MLRRRAVLWSIVVTINTLYYRGCRSDALRWSSSSSSSAFTTNARSLERRRSVTATLHRGWQSAIIRASSIPRSRGSSSSLSSNFNNDEIPPAVTNKPNSQLQPPQRSPFSLSTALFLGGLAFDSYLEPPPSSSRWERGSSGLNVAFVSNAYTRSLYRGIVEVTPIRATDLPDENDAAESLLTGKGVDAALLVSVVEGAWTEDVQKLDKEMYHNGVLDLAGCAHVGRSSTAWGNINQQQAASIMNKKKEKTGSGAYRVPSSWGKGGTAVWENESPFYLYVQDPQTARLVFTLFDEDIIGGGHSIGSAHGKLVDLLPKLLVTNKDTNTDNIDKLKSNVISILKQSGKLQDAITVQIDPNTGVEQTIVNEDVIMDAINNSYLGSSTTTASIKMTSKPRIKDKGSQRIMGMTAGAMVAGPVGAAVGGMLANMYEGEVRGRVEVGLRYTPIPCVSELQLLDTNLQRTTPRYKVSGGLPGVEWGELYEKYVNERNRGSSSSSSMDIPPADLEFCCFVTHDITGCSCAIYRSLERKLIFVSFRGTCAPKDLVTDATIAQSAWVDGESVDDINTAKVHTGFRTSLNSISRRLKELVLAAVIPGDNLANYELLVTGHSLGGALATCFVMDVAEYGMDAGRGLPQLTPSEPWWNSIASTLLGGGGSSSLKSSPAPPRPKTLKMYNFGSPRVGNDIFCNKFSSMIANGAIDEAYRIVNNQDVVARTPRTVNALVLGNIGYDHCGPTVLIQKNKEEEAGHDSSNSNMLLWIEGQTDTMACPVRDGNFADGGMGFAQREMNLLTSIFSGEGLSHHMEDQYYLGMGKCADVAAFAGSELVSTREEFNRFF